MNTMPLDWKTQLYLLPYQFIRERDFFPLSLRFLFKKKKEMGSRLGWAEKQMREPGVLTCSHL